MGTNLYWINGPWSGRLAVAARPRGGDWLEDEITNWRRAGIHHVLSLLTAQEERDLDLQNERELVQGHGMRFTSFPILDRNVPNSETELAAALEPIEKDLAAGKGVLIHCRQGVGRSGLVASCLLVSKAMQPHTAIEKVSEGRGLAIPETGEQRRWIDQYAAVLAASK